MKYNEYKEKILEAHKDFIRFYLIGDYGRMESSLLILNHFVDLALREKRN
jgi:hypothetical protein